MKKCLGILIVLCMVISMLVQPAFAAYGYDNREDLEGECGVTFASNGGSGYMEPLWYNGSFVLPECEFTAPEGYRFKTWQWNVWGETKQPGEAIYLGGVVEVIAIWEEIPEVSITFAANGGSEAMDSVTVLEGAEYTLPECAFTAPEGFRFGGWQVNEETKQPGELVCVETETEITAVWEQIPEVTITFAADGGEGTMESVTVEEGAQYTLPECTYTEPENMMFDHWEVDGSAMQSGQTITADADITITAVWAERPHVCEITPVEKTEPTKTETGKEAYYYCEGCQTAYEDEQGEVQIEDLENWGIIEAKGEDAAAMPWWIIVLICVVGAGIGMTITLLVVKKKKA